MAIARENSVRNQPNSSAIGIWNTPKLALIAKLTMIMMQPATRTGVMRGALDVFIPFRWRRFNDRSILIVFMSLTVSVFVYRTVDVCQSGAENCGPFTDDGDEINLAEQIDKHRNQ